MIRKLQLKINPCVLIAILTLPHLKTSAYAQEFSTLESSNFIASQVRVESKKYLKLKKRFDKTEEKFKRIDNSLFNATTELEVLLNDQVNQETSHLRKINKLQKRINKLSNILSKVSVKLAILSNRLLKHEEDTTPEVTPIPEPTPTQNPETTPIPIENDDFKKFNPTLDLIALHYDHAPDKDDGHSAAADRTILESIFNCNYISSNTVAVSGAYGKNAGKFNKNSDLVMDSVFNSCGGWLAADKNWDNAVDKSFAKWVNTLSRGGDIWVKEGGQSNITADIVRLIKQAKPSVNTKNRIHVVQHGQWNEDQTNKSDLTYVKNETDYQRIKDANSYLSAKGQSKVNVEEFIKGATQHPVFGTSWIQAFSYYNPNKKLDFSDTGELMHILELGEIGIDEFRSIFLDSSNSPIPISTPTNPTTNGDLFIAEQGRVILEAEATSLKGSWKSITLNGLSSIIYDGKEYFNKALPEQTVSYNFMTDLGGTYKIALHTARDDRAMIAFRKDFGNDVFISIVELDNGNIALPATKLFTNFGNKNRQFIWGTKFEQGKHNITAAQTTLKENTKYKLLLSGRSDGYVINRITLNLNDFLKDTNLPPSLVN